MDEAGNKIYDFGTDVLLDIIRRLPLSSRRRVRLVCRCWRSAVDDRTSDMLSRAVRTLICVKTTRMGTATGYVIDDLRGLARWSLRKRWTGTGDVHVIGTCNGLICLCDDGKPGGAVTLANPVTGEGLTVPPLPGQEQREPSVSSHETYSFGYHPLTGRYKIVHVPCYLGHSRTRSIAGWHDVVHVFTLGEASWRKVPLPSAVRAIGSLGIGGIVSVDGTTYWLAKGASDGQAVSFDLGDERLYATPLPVTPERGVTLTVVQGRLGVALDRDRKADVWVLYGRKWRHRYEVRLEGWQRLASPHFAHGKHVLTTRDLGSSQLYVHMLRSRRSVLVCNVLPMRGVEVHGVEGCIDRTFAYVETTEPLSVYKPAS